MTGRLKVVVTDQVFPDVDREREILAGIGADLIVADGTRAGALAEARDADALLNTYLAIDSDFVSALDRCRIVARYGIGVDNVDLAAAAAAGLTVTNVPDYCVEEVALHTATLVFALVRRLPEAQRWYADGAWGVDGIRPVRRLSEQTVGLLGYGRIARKVAAIMTSAGATVVAHDPLVRDSGDATELVDFDTLLERSDILSLHAPLTPDTRGIIDADALARLPRGGCLVNTSRGPLVVMSDLLEALRSGQLAGAGLDVFEVEPPDVAAIGDVPGLIATPHTAFYSESALRESQTKAATQVVKVLTGQAPDYAVASPAGSPSPMSNSSPTSTRSEEPS
jgi:D-3-phosphoglycerate dehydrogenase / 2-oxoglutarate reductase